MGQFNPSLIALSISSGSAIPSHTRYMASFRAGIRILFTMKPGASFCTTTVSLPIFCEISTILLMVASEVLAPRMISTSFMSCGGLKKCIPQNLSGLSVAEASSVMLMEEVLEAIRASSWATWSTSSRTLFFSSAFSGTASTIRSASCTASSRSSRGWILLRVSSISFWDILSFSTNFWRLPLIIFMPWSRNSCLISLRVTR